jgi:hypothetical protein
MPFEISPQPTPEERDVLLQALAAQHGAAEPPSRWWEAGIRETVEADPDEIDAPDQASARPRSSAGALRA